MLRQYVEKAEFFYKDLIGNKFAELKCQTPPYDQHYDVNNYYDKTGIAKTLQNFSKEKSYYFLCRELIPGYLNVITGVYQTTQGYYVKDQDVEEFDKQFPPKEKKKLPGQLFD